MIAKRNTIFFTVVLLTGLITCSDDPYPVYNEGEVLWQVTEVPVLYTFSEMEPALTPDGKCMVFKSVYSDFPNHSRLMKIDLATEEETMITAFGYGTDLSPDGQWLAFNSLYGGISKVKLNGDSLILLTSDDDFSPSWSPNGSSIIYNHSTNDMDSNDPAGLWQMSENGSNKHFKVKYANFPDFYPDGNTVIGAFTYSDGIKFPVYNILTGHNLHIVKTDGAKEYSKPRVSPDGQKILFSNLNGITIMNSDGTSRDKIVPYKHFYEYKQGDYLGFIAESPSWHPDGKHIVYQHFAITEHTKCPDNMYCTYSENFKGIASIRLLRIE